MEPGSPTLQADSLPAEPQGKPKSLIVNLNNSNLRDNPMGKKYSFSGLNSAPQIFLEGERGEMSTLPEFVLT